MRGARPSPGETPGRVLWGVSQGCCRSRGGQHLQGGIAWLYPSPTRNEARDWRQRRPPPTQSGHPMPGTPGAAPPAVLTVSAAHTPAPACGPGRVSGGVRVYTAPWPQPATDVRSQSRAPPLRLPPVAAMTRPAPPSAPRGTGVWWVTWGRKASARDGRLPARRGTGECLVTWGRKAAISRLSRCPLWSTSMTSNLPPPTPAPESHPPPLTLVAEPVATRTRVAQTAPPTQLSEASLAHDPRHVPPAPQHTPPGPARNVAAQGRAGSCPSRG